MAGINFKAFDLGGHEIARRIWKDYFAKVCFFLKFGEVCFRSTPLSFWSMQRIDQVCQKPKRNWIRCCLMRTWRKHPF